MFWNKKAIKVMSKVFFGGGSDDGESSSGGSGSFFGGNIDKDGPNSVYDRNSVANAEAHMAAESALSPGRSSGGYASAFNDLERAKANAAAQQASDDRMNNLGRVGSAVPLSTRQRMLAHQISPAATMTPDMASLQMAAQSGMLTQNELDSRYSDLNPGMAERAALSGKLAYQDYQNLPQAVRAGFSALSPVSPGAVSGLAGMLQGAVGMSPYKDPFAEPDNYAPPSNGLDGNGQGQPDFLGNAQALPPGAGAPQSPQEEAALAGNEWAALMPTLKIRGRTLADIIAGGQNDGRFA